MITNSLIMGIGGIEWAILIIVFIFLIFGSKKLPEISKTFGKAIGEYQRTKNKLVQDLNQSYIEQTSSYPNFSNHINEGPLLSPRDKLLKIAMTLNIPDFETKTDEELIEIINEKMKI